MPEAPEVQKLMEALRRDSFWGKKVTATEVRHPFLLKNASLSEWERFWIGNSFVSVERRAKYLIFNLKWGYYLTHQRFTGWFNVEDDMVKRIHSLNASKQESNNRIVWEFGSGDKRLCYRDARCLSVHKINMNPAFKETDGLAPDCLDELMWEHGDVPFETLAGDTKYRFVNKDIKSYLIDQRGLVSGIGNYLACEILWQAKLDPWRKMGSLTEQEQRLLYNKVRTVPIQSMRSTDYSWFGVFRVKTCPACQGPVSRKVHSGTGPKGQATYYCSSCQNVAEEVNV